MIKVDYETYAGDIFNKENVIAYRNTIERAKDQFLQENKKAGWYQFDSVVSEEELQDVKTTAEYIRNNCQVFIVVGIGGSYLGAKGIIDALSPYFEKKNPEIIFAGNSLSSDYLSSLMEYIKDKEVIINVISKSGNTIEPSISFNMLYRLLKSKYSDEEIKKRIIVTTDHENGKLLEAAKVIGCKRFIFPTNVGGRFSTLTVVGLLPIAVAGIDIDALLAGAQEAKNNSKNCYSYIAFRDVLYRQGKTVEIFNVYEPKLASFLDWVQQILAETQGKKEKGLLPVPMVCTTKLHSLGQYLQEGKNTFFETSIDIEISTSLQIGQYQKRMDTINSIALKSVAEAHKKDKRYTFIITLDELNAYNMGYLYAFFSMASAFGSYLLGIEYSTEPGVLKYKEVMKEKLDI